VGHRGKPSRIQENPYIPRGSAIVNQR
jgi:hypothetical protein